MIYGTHWTIELENWNLKDLTELWTDALDGITVDEIKLTMRRITRAETKFSGFPPTAPQFRELCLGSRTELARQKPKEKAPELLHISQRYNEAQWIKMMRDLKNAIKGMYTPVAQIYSEGDSNMAG